MAAFDNPRTILGKDVIVLEKRENIKQERKELETKREKLDKELENAERKARSTKASKEREDLEKVRARKQTELDQTNQELDRTNQELDGLSDEIIRQNQELKRLDLALEKLWKKGEPSSPTPLEPLLERLHLRRQTLPSLVSKNGSNPSLITSALQDDCAAKSWILEYDRADSPFFRQKEQKAKWRSLRQTKETVVKQWVERAKEKMNKSSLCKRLLFKGSDTNKLRKELMDLGPLKDYDRALHFDELYLWELVSKLLSMEEEGIHNPLLEPSSLLEGWLGAHLHAPWTDRCFQNIGDVTKGPFRGAELDLSCSKGGAECRTKEGAACRSQGGHAPSVQAARHRPHARGSVPRGKARTALDKQLGPSGPTEAPEGDERRLLCNEQADP